jgi:hypothetical protein
MGGWLTHTHKKEEAENELWATVLFLQIATKWAVSRLIFRGPRKCSVGVVGLTGEEKEEV